MSYNLNAFILMISISRIKNTFNNLSYIKIDGNVIQSTTNDIFKSFNIKKNTSDIFILNYNDTHSSSVESNNLSNSFVNIDDNLYVDLDEWNIIYDDTNILK